MKKTDQQQAVVVYFLIALVLYTMGDISWYYKYKMPSFLRDNNFLYNINSVCRLFLFVIFFHKLNIPANKKLQVGMLVLLAVLVICNFIFVDSFFAFSSRTFTLESFVLLCYCVNYFLKIKK